MADVNANIGIHIDTSQSLAEIKNLQRQLAQLYTSINKGSAAAAAAQKGLATNLMNTINAGGKFYAQMGTIRTSTESFTHALEKNKLSMREYFRFAGGSTRTFGRLFKQEFDTIGRVAEERVKKMQTQYIKLGRDASGAMKAISITPTTLNMKEYGNQVAVAAQRQALLNQLLKQGSTNLLNFGKNTQWAGRQLMVGFTIPLAYFGTAAAKTFMDLEAQALKFKRVYGDMFTTSDQTAKALGDIEALAKEFTKYGVAVSKTMEMAASAAAMGKTGAELTEQVANATRLSVLGNVEQAQALETTISLTNAFGIAAEDLTKKINFLNAVENQTVVSIEDLTIAVPKAGPVVKQLGGSVEDLAFFLTAMKEGGINASEGANALKSGLASLINPSEKASKMLAGMGINIKGIVEANKGDVKGIVLSFAAALDTLDPLNRARAIEQLFGKFQFARLSTLFANVTKEGTQAAKVLDLMGASVEELAILSERELKAVEDAVGTNFKAAVEELKLTIAPIGKEFLKAITPVVEFLGRLFDKFNNLSDGSKKFIVILTTLVGLVGPTLLMTFGLVANGAANIIKLFLLMRQGFLKLSGNTTNLAQQTQYMTTEQQEAAVVAASLNQAHTRLTQQFTLEAGAVNQLRNAYVQATAAATRFAAANPGMMMPGFRGIKGGGTKGFNRGTIKVPGYQKGTDSVPAMLTPGEAVIPEPIAQDDRFKPLIAALISGEIKKYNKGTPDAGSNFAHVGKGKLTNLDQIIAGAKTQKQREQAVLYRDILKAAGKPTVANAYGDLGFTFSAEANRALATRNGVSLDAFEKEWVQRGVSKWKASGISPSLDAEIIDREILKEIKKLRVTRVTDDVIEKAFRNLAPQIKNTPTYGKMASLHEKVGAYSLGRGLGSTPKSSAAILEQAKKSGIIKDYYLTPNIGPDGKERPGKLGRLKVITKDGKEVDLGRGSRAERIPFKKSAWEGKIVAAKGEAFKTQDGKEGVVTGQTGKAKPSGRNVTASPRDTRIMSTQNLAKIFPYGIKGPRYAGAVGGWDDGSSSPAKGIRSGGLPKAQSDDLVKAIKDNTKSQDDGTQTQEKTAKELKRDQRAAKAQRIGTYAGPAAMAAGTGAMVAAMTGAPQAITNMLFGISAVAGLLPLLANPLGIAIAAVAAVGVGLWKLSSDLKNASKEGANLAKSMTMTNSKLVELSKVTRTVSATESAKRRRETMLTGASGVQRKTGQTILESGFGQNLLGDIQAQQKAGASEDQVAKSISLGLSTAIMQGVLTTEQARSLAAALGEKLGSYDIPAKISGNIVNLVGPNGERLESQPLQVALEIKKQSMEQQAQVFQNAISQRNKTLGTGGEFAAAAGMVGVGALAGGPVGAAVGAGVAIKMIFDQNKLKAENLQLDTAAIQLGFEAVAQGQGLVDSLNRQYDNKIKQAKTDDEINELEKQRKSAIEAVNKENAKTLDALIKQKDQFTPGAFDAAIKAAADTMYKEGPMAVFKDQTIAALSELENSEFKTMLQLGLASGEMDPNQILAFINMAKDNPTLKTNFDFIISTQGMAEANVLIGLLEKAGANENTYTIITNFVKENPEQFKDVQDAISAVSNILPKYGVTVDINTVGLKQLQQIQRITNTLKTEKGPITQEIIAKYAKDPNNPDQSVYQGILDTWNTLVGSSNTITKEMIIDFSATYSDPNVKDFLNTSKGLSGVPQHIQDLAGGTSAQASAYLIGTGTGSQTGGKTTTTTTDTVDTGTRDTHLDDLLKKLKFIRKASIDAEKGVGELLRITSGKGLTKFAGVTQQLMSGPKGGSNREFISFLEQMDNKTRALYMTIKNGQVVLTQNGKNLKEAFNEKVIGEYQVAQYQAIQDAKAQESAFIKLKAAGVSTAQALEMVSDANLAVAINAKSISSKELAKMAADAKKAADAQELFNLKLEASKSAENLKTLEKTAKVLSVISKTPGISKEALSRVAQSPVLMERLYKQIFEGAKKGAKDINDLLNDAAKERTANFRVQVNIDPSAAIQGALDAALGPAMSSMQAVINAQTRVVSAKYLSQIATKKREIASIQGSPDYVDTQKAIANQQAKITQQQGVVSRLNTQISAIDQEISNIQNQIQETMANATKDIDARIDKANEEVATLKRAVELEFDKPIQDLQRQIDAIEQSVQYTFTHRIDDLNETLNDLQRQIEIQFGRPIEILQRESKGLSNELQDIDDLADKINEKYDLQQQELQKVADLNEKIANSQKQQLDLADAITKGDASAAARAMQEMRAQAAKDAAESQGDILNAARNAEVRNLRSKTGRTRKQIEERQKQIDAEVRSIEAAQERFEQEKNILGIKDQIYDLEEQREASLLKIRDIQKNIDDLEAKRLPRLIEIENKEREILLLEADREKAIAAAEKSVEKLQNDIDKLTRDKNRLNGEIAAAQKALSALETDATYLANQAKLDGLNKEIADIEAEIAALEAEMAAAIANDEKLQGIIDKMNAAEDALASAYLEAFKKTGQFATDLATISDAAKIAADAVAEIFKTGDEFVGGSDADANYDKKTGFNRKTNTQSKGAQSDGSSATAKGIGKIATELGKAKEPATAVAKSTKDIKDHVEKFEPKLKTITEYISSQAEKMPTVKDAFAAIAEIIKNINIKPYSEGIETANNKAISNETIWGRIKTAISNAIASLDSFISKLISAFSQSQNLINSLNTTTTTTHIIRTVYETVGAPPSGTVPPVAEKMYGGKIQGFAGGGKVKTIYRPMGGLIPYMANGGFKPRGSDTVPAMLTPGEFVVNRASTQAFMPLLSAINDSKFPSSIAGKMFDTAGDVKITRSFNTPEYSIMAPSSASFSQPFYNVNNLSSVVAPVNNSSTAVSDNSSTVYNYSVGISVGGTNADPKNIAKAVINEIKYIDSQRIRTQRA